MLALLFVCPLLLASPQAPQTDTLLSDIRPGIQAGTPAGSYQWSLGVLGDGRAVFSANDGYQSGLYVSDGTNQGTTSLNNGASDPLQPKGQAAQLPDGRIVFFSATNAAGIELSVSDGTPAGTQQIADLTPGPESGGGVFPVAWNGKVYFLRETPDRAELWSTDGNPDDATLVRGLGPIAPRALIALPGQLIVLSQFGTHETRIHRSDGTTPGTELVQKISGRVYRHTTSFNGSCGFIIEESEDWFGTPIYSVYAVDGSGAPATLLDDGPDVLWLQAFGDQLAFALGIPISPFGPELNFIVHVSDGTALGTESLGHKVIDFGQGWTQPAPLGDGLVFAGFSFGGPGVEPWYTDGTITGTILLSDVLPGPVGSRPEGFGTFGDLAVFTCVAPDTGRELWSTDGTPAGTRLIDDFTPGPDDTLFSGGRIRVGDRLIVPLLSPVWGSEPHITDAQPGPITLLKDIAQNPPASSDPQLLRRLGERIVFTADDGVHGRELWTSDGTAAGTTLVSDLAPGPASGAPTQIVRLGDRLIFDGASGADGLDRELWSTDGTPSGTVLVRDINQQAESAPSSPTGLIVLGDRVLFTAYDDHGWEPWVSDGSPGGTVRLGDFYEDSAITPFPLDSYKAPEILGASNDLVFFSWRQAGFGVPDTGSELFRSDGTPAGTQLIAELALGASDSAMVGAALPGGFVFAWSDSFMGLEPWFTDGTAAGTALIEGLLPGPNEGRIFQLVQAGDRVVFTRSIVAGTPLTLWSTDGTATGSFPLVTDLQNISLAADQEPSDFLDFVIRDEIPGLLNGLRLFRTDGLSTELLHEWQAPTPGSFLMNPLGTDAVRLFEGFSQESGLELWSVASGLEPAVQVADAFAGPVSGIPRFAMRAGDWLYFSARTPGEGRELHALPFAALNTPLIQPFGVSCSATGLDVRLDAAGAPELGQTTTIAVSDGPPAALGFLFFSDGILPADLGLDCTLYLAAPKFAGSFTTDGTGSGSLGVGVPASSAAIGLSVTFQAALVEAQGPALGGFALSSGLELIVGP